ncbi:MAG: hypothetical protein ABIN89_06600 [Chitinophagaceae bacterium]
MKKIFLPVLIVVFLILVWDECFSQSKDTLPKNFFSLFGGVELNSTSILAGAEYEGVIWKKNKFLLGIKGMHVFKHRNGNLILYNGSNYGSSSFTAVMPTFHYFTTRRRKNNNGFFLYSGLGVGWRHESFEKKYYRTATSFETGVGLQFNLGSQVSMKLTNSILLSGENGIALTKLSLGL